MLSTTTSSLFIATTKVAALGPFVVGMNRVDVPTSKTIFVLRLSTAGRTVGRTDSRLDGGLVGRTPLKNKKKQQNTLQN